MKIQVLSGHDPAWYTQIEQPYRLLAGDPALLPRHFVQSALPKLGGRLALVTAGDELRAVGFLLPRSLEPKNLGVGTARYGYTLRYHALPGRPSPTAQMLTELIQDLLSGHPVTLYDPNQPHTFHATSCPVNGLDIGHPSAAEALQVPRIQQQVWQASADALYPADIHSRDFGLGTSLVARVEQEVAGFLIGFYRADGSPLPAEWYARFGAHWRLESQIMGVLPAYRGRDIAYSLKKVQADHARRDGIALIHWTADPLQWPNGRLNFGALGAIAYEFVPNVYQFRNELNQVAASRFSLTWLVETARVRQRLDTSAPTPMFNLADHPTIRRVNDGWRTSALDADAAQIAFEIPANWTALQNKDVDEALRWREATDRLFSHYIGLGDGKYVITGVGQDGNRCYLIAARAAPSLWVQLGA